VVAHGLLDNTVARIHLLHSYLSEVLDPVTKRIVTSVTDGKTLGTFYGANVLEVGASNGSMALHWAEEVGASGHVTTITSGPESTHIPRHPRLTLRPVDLTRPGAPIPEGPFDLIHARMVLSRLPNRMEVLDELVRRLSPGGLLAVGEWRIERHTSPVIMTDSDDDAWLYQKYTDYRLEILAGSGVSQAWAVGAYRAMRDAGLHAVQTVIHAEYWPGGKSGCQLLAAELDAMYSKLTMRGWTEVNLCRVARFLARPSTVLHGMPLYYTTGRREPGPL
jgi:SAM-dependent methyltransferase